MSLKEKKILVVGASSDLASSLNNKLISLGAVVGLHYNSNDKALSIYKEGSKIKKIQKTLDSAESCCSLVDEFLAWAGEIHGLVQLSGDISRPVHWEQLTDKDWSYDLTVNLITPFFLAQRAIKHMKLKGGRVVLMSTASAAHGGGSNSLAYGVAKAGVECLVKGMARDCAKYNILVNAVAPGYFLTKFHTEKMKRTEEQLSERGKLTPLKRPGTVEEFAETVLFLLSDSASYITGQVISISGGDWL